MISKRTITLWIIIGLFGSITYLGYRLFSLPGHLVDPFHLLPENAVFMLETGRPLEVWQELNEQESWKFLQTNQRFAHLTEDLTTFDSLLQQHRTSLELLGDHRLLVSAHIKEQSYAMLYILDLRNGPSPETLKPLLYAFPGEDIKLSTRQINERQVMVFTDQQEPSSFYLATVNNCLIGSFDLWVVEEALQAYPDPWIRTAQDFHAIRQPLDDHKAGNVYIRFDHLDEYLGLWMSDSASWLASLSETFTYTGLQTDWKHPQEVKLSGHSMLDPDHLLPNLLSGKRGATGLEAIAPENTALLVALGGGSFAELYQKMANGQAISGDWQNYGQQVEKFEKYLHVDLQEHFFSWTGDELGLIQLSIPGLSPSRGFALAIRVKDTEKAVRNLDYITRQIRKKTPSKFKSLDYLGYSINYLSVKDFFKLFFGRLFARLEKPYYTMIGQYVVFANHPLTLKRIIGAYTREKTLAKSPSYDQFRNARETGVYAYLNMQHFFPLLESYVETETWQRLQEDRAYFTYFNRMAFQLTGNDKTYRTELWVTRGDDTDLTDDQLLAPLQDLNYLEEEEIFAIAEITPEDLDVNKHREYYPDGSLKLEVGMKDGLKNGIFRDYHPNGALKTKGRYKDDLPEGLWKNYDVAGALLNKIRYRKGRPVEDRSLKP